jgi:AhpD family alkylhydroperoxidase
MKTNNSIAWSRTFTILTLCGGFTPLLLAAESTSGNTKSKVATTQNAGTTKWVSLQTLNQETQKNANVQEITLTPQAVTASQQWPLIEAGQVPNYLRVLSTRSETAGAFAHLIRTAIFEGAVAPEIKMAMGLRIAQMHNNAYVATHLQRWMRARPQGTQWLQRLDSSTAKFSESETLALDYARDLTRNIHGVDDAKFRQLRQVYNEEQIVEMTLTVCFFNYFTRLTAGHQLGVESWALQNPVAKLAGVKPYEAPTARVSLISDAEVEAFATTSTPPATTVTATTGGAASLVPTATGPTAPAVDTRNSLGIRVANSRRAMMRAPGFGTAWFDYWKQVRAEPTLPRELMLQISFAVSMVNGCRYCTLHQVQGLRRLGIEPAKLVAMKKDDSVLSARELVAVNFARKMTRNPQSVTAADYQKLETEFGTRGAQEVLLQTCAFNFMNRFTDGLNLPSEDEAIHTYREVYGADYSR